MDSDKTRLRVRYKLLRKRILSLTPFVRRSRHERALLRIDKYLRLERKAHEALGYLFFSAPPLATSACHELRGKLSTDAAEDVCIFVTHGFAPQLKPHVVDHIEALLAANVAVVLVVNTDLERSAIQIPAHLSTRLHGCMIRENVGYDFAAWAHVYSLLDPRQIHQRLYLVNDSIVGPLDRAAYFNLIERIRGSTSDLVGLTCNPDPHDHLQSFFLVFNDRLLHSTLFDSFMRRVVSMATKESVVASYEMWLTPFLQMNGYTVEALFPNISTYGPPTRNDTLSHWKELVDAGFPFIKSAVLASNEADEARKVLPDHYSNAKPMPVHNVRSEEHS